MNVRLFSLALSMAGAALFLFAAPAAAQWTLMGGESRIGFVSVKAGDVAESHYFRKMNGAVAADGAAEIRIALDSVETNIDIRNERMRAFLFETDTHPEAVIAATVDLGAFSDLPVGGRENAAFAGELTLHGVTAPVETTVTVTRIGENRVLVETADPFILYTDFFDLGAGVEKLREIAGLPSIVPSSPVAASLVFEREE